MDHVSLGRTGMQVSRLCLGCMNFGSPKWRPWIMEEEQSRPFLKKALDAGFNFFDTADAYSRGESEAILGRFLADQGVPRHRVVIATKVYFPTGDDPNARGLSRKHVMAAIDDSLRRLKTDHVDLYQIHRFDPRTPIEETLDALNDVVRAGKARYLGASSMFAWQLSEMLHVSEKNGWARFVSMQNHYNLVYREEEREMLPLCRARGLGVIPWSPLARGFLAGNRAKEGWGDTQRAQSDDFAHEMYYRPSDFAVVERLTAVARSHGVSNARVALAWLLHQPGVTAPILGPSRLEHLDDAVGALSLRLSDDELAALAAPYEPHPVLGHS